MLVYTSITNEGLQTNLVTCHLFPVVMTSFNKAGSLSLERLVNMHLTICHTLFKTNFHINFNIKRFYLDRGCGTTAGRKTFHLLLGGKPQAHCTTHSMTSWPVSANTSKIKSISKFSRYITIDSHHSHPESVDCKSSTTVLVLDSIHNVILWENNARESSPLLWSTLQSRCFTGAHISSIPTNACLVRSLSQILQTCIN